MNNKMEITKENLNILHLSDIHYSEANKSEIETKLKEISDLINRESLIINLVLITGDLVDAGIEYDSLSSILKNFIYNDCKLTEGKVVIVPGNHDIDFSQISKALEKNMSEEKIKDILSDEETLYLYKKKLDKFYEFKKNFYTCRNDILEIRNIQNISCIEANSALFVSNENESHGSLYIPIDTIKEITEPVDSTLSILAIHHPLSYLNDLNKNEFERLLSRKIDILFHGHIHDKDEYEVIRENGNYITIGAPAFSSNLNKKTGFNIVTYHPNNGVENSLELISFKFSGTDITKNSKFFNFTPKNKRSALENKIISLKSRILPILSAEGIYDSLLNENSSKTSFSDLFFPNKICEISSNRDRNLIDLKKIISGTENYIILGKPQAGKSSMLKYFYNEILLGGMSLIPVLLDMDSISGGTKTILGKITKETQSDKDSIKEILENNKLVLLIDNIDSSEATEKSKNALFELIKDYNIRFIGTAKENIVCDCIINEFSNFNYTLCAIEPIGLDFLRGTLKKWSKIFNFNAEQAISHVVEVFSKLRIPRTPMSLIMIFNIIQNKTYRVSDIENEYALVDTYLRILTGAFDFKESELSKIRDSFLKYLALTMYKKQISAILSFDFDNLKHNFILERGLNHNIADEFSVLFDKRILLKDCDGKVSFTFDFYFYFYLSKCLMEDSELFNSFIKDDAAVLLYLRSLEYVSDSHRNKGVLLETIHDILKRSLSEQDELYSFDELECTNLSCYIHETINDLKDHIESTNSEKVTDIQKERKLEKVDKYNHEVNHDAETFNNAKNSINKRLFAIPYYARIVRNLIDCNKDVRAANVKYVLLFYSYMINTNLKFLKYMLSHESLKHVILKNISKYKRASENDVNDILKFVKDIILQFMPPSILTNLCENISSITLINILKELSISESEPKDLRLMSIIVIFFTDISEGVNLLTNWYKNSKNLKNRYMNSIVFWTLTMRILRSKLTEREKNGIATVMEKLIKRGEIDFPSEMSEFDILANRAKGNKTLKMHIKDNINKLSNRESRI